MSMWVYWHDDCLGHDTGSGHFEAGPSPLLACPEPHPEGSERLVNMRSVLERGPLAPLISWREARPATPDELELFHDPAHVAAISRLQALDEPTHLEGPTWASPGTWRAARAAAGCSMEAARAVLEGRTEVAYALVRPPGHHAGPSRTDGGCFFNNAGLAACAAIEGGADRVAVFDFDAHHGNGTQTGFYDRADVLTISVHMDHGPWDAVHHPETGRTEEVGVGAGVGYNLNIPLPYGSGDDGYLAVMEQLVVPALTRFQPTLIVCAAGQDAGQVDPNGRQCVTLNGFRALGRRLAMAADEVCEGRLVLTQEGGYAKTHAAFGVLATACGILDANCELEDPYAYLPDHHVEYQPVVDAVRRQFSKADSGLLGRAT